MPSFIAIRRKSKPGVRRSLSYASKAGWKPIIWFIADEIAKIETEVAAEIADGVAFAEAAGWEPIEHLTRFTYAERNA